MAIDPQEIIASRLTRGLTDRALAEQPVVGGQHAVAPRDPSYQPRNRIQFGWLQVGSGAERHLGQDPSGGMLHRPQGMFGVVRTGWLQASALAIDVDGGRADRPPGGEGAGRNAACCSTDIRLAQVPLQRRLARGVTGRPAEGFEVGRTLLGTADSMMVAGVDSMAGLL